MVTRRRIGYRDGLRLDLVRPAAPGPHPLVVYVPGGGFVRAPRGLARRERAFVAAAGYAVASVEYRTVRQHATVAGLTDPRILAVVDEFRASDVSVMAGGFDERMRTALADPRHPVRRYGATETNPVDLVRADAPAFLFLHGDDDRIVPPAQTFALHRALQEAGADSAYYLLSGAGHGMLSLSRHQTRQWTSVQVLTLITELLDRRMRS